MRVHVTSTCHALDLARRRSYTLYARADSLLVLHCRARSSWCQLELVTTSDCLEIAIIVIRDLVYYTHAFFLYYVQDAFLREIKTAESAHSHRPFSLAEGAGSGDETSELWGLPMLVWAFC